MEPITTDQIFAELRERLVNDTTKRAQAKGRGTLQAEPSKPRVNPPDDVLKHLRGELGRLRKRVRGLEDAAKRHEHQRSGPVQKNGMHIDIAGDYWMHRPDGWHMVGIDRNALGTPKFPVQRLAEKDAPHHGG